MKVLMAHMAVDGKTCDMLGNEEILEASVGYTLPVGGQLLAQL